MWWLLPLTFLSACIDGIGGKDDPETDATGDDTGDTGTSEIQDCIDQASSAGASSVFLVSRLDDPTPDSSCTNYVSDGYFASDDCSLREAVIAANQSFSDSFICLPSGTIELSIAGTDEDAALTGDLDFGNGEYGMDNELINVTIVGQGSEESIVDAARQDRVFQVMDDVTVTMNDFQVYYGRAEDGGGIYSGGNLTLNRMSLVGNYAGGDEDGSGGDGGAVYTDFMSRIAVSDSTFHANAALQDGGALYLGFNLDAVSVSGNTFTDNQADEGGAIAGEDFTVESCSFSGNTALSYGGALYSSSFDSTLIIDCSFDGNSASDGGAAYIRGDSTSITGSSFMNNSANDVDDPSDAGGGALSIDADSFDMTGSTFSGNISSGEGGGIYLFADVATISDSEFLDNYAGTEGGGIYGWNMDSQTTLQGVTLSGNSAEKGGGAYLGDMAYVSESTVSDNTSTDGAGIYFYGSPVAEYFLVRDTIFRGNTATQHGGALYASLTVGYISSSTFDSNLAYCGGGFYNDASTTDIVNTSWYGNEGAALCNDSNWMTGDGYNNTVVEAYVMIDHSSFSGNEGALNNRLDTKDGITVKSSLFADNNSAGVDSACFGNIASADYNIDKGESCESYFIGSYDQTSTDPLFDPIGLFNYGGWTDLLGLLSVSPAIDTDDGLRIDGTVLAQDQKGTSRPQGTASDRGTFEMTE